MVLAGRYPDIRYRLASEQDQGDCGDLLRVGLSTTHVALYTVIDERTMKMTAW
jgi:hypothetical protein